MSQAGKGLNNHASKSTSIHLTDCAFYLVWARYDSEMGRRVDKGHMLQSHLYYKINPRERLTMMILHSTCSYN